VTRVIIRPKKLFVPKKPAILRIWDEDALEYTEGGGGIISAAVGGCAAATAFLARANTLAAPYIDPITTFICGSVSKGLINSDGTSNVFDVLYLFATQDTTNALLNIVSSSYTGTTSGSPTFTAGRGFTGTDQASSPPYINTGFNPRTASSPIFVQNSAHISMWSNTNAQAVNGGCCIGAFGGGGGTESDIFPKYSDGKAYFRINDAAPQTSGVTNANSTGHYIATRSSSGSQNGYINAVDQGISPITSGLPPSLNIIILAGNLPTDPTAINGGGYQVCMASIGASLNSTQTTDFYNLLRAYMTAVGVP
jgi:hypothetical protein